MFKLAICQMLIEPGLKDANLRRAETMVSRAADEGADVVLLPEALNLGWSDPTALTKADDVENGFSCGLLRDSARQNSVYVCGGIVERDRMRVYNSAVLIDPDGRVILYHRKINELAMAQEFYAPGDRLGVVDTPLGRFGLMVCADAFAKGQVISRTLGYMNADVILSPCSWAVPEDHDQRSEPYGKLWLDNYVPVARDFRMWIAASSNVGRITAGPWTGRKCIGCSMVVDSEGNLVLLGNYGVDAEEIEYADIRVEPRPARGGIWEEYWAKQARL
ncbi:MAG: carbon-nitrogen hydrolase family protein [Verrucomicrobia bacterium]|nr:carbon-nitrogen hydrolase family protein [Verrucomicrobiota bacterium]